MIDVNIKAVHVLTKLFLKDFVKHNRGFVLNVASIAAFAPGPLMATYYATKTYVLNITNSIAEDLRNQKSNVYIGCLCPGPVKTNFDEVAGVSFSLKGMDRKKVAKYAVKEMFKRKQIIIPGFKIKCGYKATKIFSNRMVAESIFKGQKKKLGNN